MYEIILDHMTSRGYELSLTTVESLYKDFIKIPVVRSRKLIGVILLKGNEIHCIIKPQYQRRWFNKGVFHLLNDIIKEYGKVTTKVMNDYTVGHLFAQRLGFNLVSVDNIISNYELKELKHECN